MHAGHLFARYEPAADPSPPPQERTQGLPAIQIDQAQLVEACSEGDIDLYIYISTYTCATKTNVYTNGLAVLLGRDGSQVPLVKELIYIYPPLGKNGASTAWYLICVHLYIVLVQTRTGEYVYIYTHIYIAFRKPIDSLTAPTPPTSVSSTCFRASGLRKLIMAFAHSASSRCCRRRSRCQPTASSLPSRRHSRFHSHRSWRLSRLIRAAHTT